MLVFVSGSDLLLNSNTNLLCNRTKTGEKNIVSDIKASFFFLDDDGEEKQEGGREGGEDGREDGEKERPGC